MDRTALVGRAVARQAGTGCPASGGSEWLTDEIAGWQRADVNTVFSLLTGEEALDLGLAKESEAVQALGMKFLSYPIPDRQAPGVRSRSRWALERLEAELIAGRNVVLHCRQGIGRTGLVAVCLFVTKGVDPGAAVDRISAARGLPVPETPEQRQWIDRHATSLSLAR